MSNIEWTDQTWNPIIGCSNISPGCDNCYAEKIAGRLANIAATTDDYSEVVLFKQQPVTEKINPVGQWSGEMHFVESALEKPLRWHKPRMIFICSMGDFFHKNVPFDWIDKVFEVIKHSPQHTFQILTKRPERMFEYFNFKDVYTGLPNVWLGVTAENQDQANKRIPTLLEIPAAKHFISIEPMLGEIDLTRYEISRGHYRDWLTGARFGSTIIEMTGKLDWVIVGGERGHNARPIHPDWARSIRDQCKEANVPFFFKQWGEWVHIHELTCNGTGVKGKLWHNFDPDTSVCRVGKKLAGRLLDSREYNEFPKS
jgi:protein gp37